VERSTDDGIRLRGMGKGNSRGASVSQISARRGERQAGPGWDTGG
jgi:hypothetical protein